MRRHAPQICSHVNTVGAVMMSRFFERISDSNYTARKWLFDLKPWAALIRVLHAARTSMLISVRVALLSGQSACITAGTESLVEGLRQTAQKELGVGLCRLISDSGVVLQGTATLLEAGLQDGETLCAIVRHTEIVSTIGAFALLCADGTVVTWGDADFGADSSAVQAQLQDVQQIRGSDGAFAALLSDGTVVTWGDEDFGGQSSVVQDRLVNVVELRAFGVAFAATLADGSTVCWGSPNIQPQLQHASMVAASNGACAIILDDSSVFAWGHDAYGADTSSVSERLRDVRHIQATWTGAFAAVLGDGTVVSWGRAQAGGDESAVREQLRDVRQIQSSESAFAALLGDGSVVTWGHADCGGDSSAVQESLKNAVQIQASWNGAFAALLADGSVVSWGDATAGGDCSVVSRQLKEVQQIQSSGFAFAAICADGSVVTWGADHAGGDSSSVQEQLRNVQQVQGTSSYQHM